jgi:DME family drug/metabolite transporter
MRSAPRTALTAASCLWAVGPVLVASSGVPALQLTALRSLAGAALLLALLKARRGRLGLTAVLACAPGGLCFAVSTCALFASVKSTSIADAALISALQPVVLLLHPDHGRSRTPRSLALLAGALCGTALVMIGSSGGGHRSARGDALAVVALLTGCGYLLATRRARRVLSPVQVQCGAQLVSALALAPVVLLGPYVPVNRAAMLTVLAIILVPGTGHLLLAWAVSHLPPTTTAQLGLLNPLVAVLLAALLLDQPVNTVLLVGAATVLACVAALASADVVDRSAAPTYEPA